MKATEHGKKLIQSESFAEDLSLVVFRLYQQLSPDDLLCGLRVYTAMALATSSDGVAWMETQNDGKEVSRFIAENLETIDEAITRVAAINLVSGVACGAIKAAHA